MGRQSFQIGLHTISKVYPPFLIAEAGVHHFNSLELAKNLVLHARVAGAHAIKFQTYKAARLAAVWAPTYWDDPTGQTQYQIFAQRSLLTNQDYDALFEYARELGIVFLSTPFDIESAEMLNEFGMEAFKIASADLTNYPLLRAVAKFGKPVLLSTGASTFDEIRGAVNELAQFNAPLALLHCNLTYPTILKDANLQRITELQEQYPDILIGYSDHTQPQDSEIACPIAVALGARIIEKHYTLNKQLPGDDHYHAVDQTGLVKLVKNCRDAYTMTESMAELNESERAARTNARRSIVAGHELSEGHIITAGDIDFKRPGTGMSPTMVESVIGKRVKKPIAADELITIQNVEM